MPPNDHNILVFFSSHLFTISFSDSLSYSRHLLVGFSWIIQFFSCEKMDQLNYFFNNVSFDRIQTKSNRQNWLNRPRWHGYNSTAAFSASLGTSQQRLPIWTRISLRHVKWKNRFISFGRIMFWPQWDSTSGCFDCRFLLSTHNVSSSWLCTEPQAYSYVSRGG